MSVNFGLVSETTFAEKMDMLTAMIGRVGGSGEAPSSWAGVQAIVRAGLAQKVFNIGDQLMCKKGGENGTTLVWDVIGFDHDVPSNNPTGHSMTLALHDAYTNERQYDMREAFYCVPSGGLLAGKHYFYIGKDVAGLGVGYYSFTLDESISAGSQFYFNITLGTDGYTKENGVLVYESAASTTANEKKITLSKSVSEPSDGNNIGTLSDDGGGDEDDFNTITNAFYGSNSYKESAIRQWLNSYATAGSVWTAQNKWDRAPRWLYDNTPEKGWMNDLDFDFLNAVGTVNKRTSIVGGGETTEEKFFLLGREEVFAGQWDAQNEGGPYDYFKANRQSASAAADDRRVKYYNGQPCYWWLRNAYTKNLVGQTYVDIDYQYFLCTPKGQVTATEANKAYGIIIACNIV